MVNASVVIPTYNRAEILKLTLSSLMRQSYARDRFEVLVVDDGSSDHTPKVVRSFCGCLRIRYFYQRDEGYRLSRARNIGIENAHGEVVIFLDSDIVVCPEYVAEHVGRHFNSEISTVVVGYIYGFGPGVEKGSLLRLINFEDITQSTEVLRRNRALWDLREAVYRKVDDDLSSLPAPWRFSWGGSMSVRKRDIEKVGMFDEDFRSWGAEDIEFGYRCFKKGLRFVLNRNAWGVHYPHANDLDGKRESNWRNMLLFYQRHPNPEIELCTVARQFKYNELWENIRRLVGQNLLPEYSSSRFRKVLGLLKGRSLGTLDQQYLMYQGTTLIVGCGEGFVAAELDASVAIDFDRDKVTAARERFSWIDFQWALGVRLLCPDKCFDRVVITDLWRGLGRICLGKLLREAVTVGREVFVLYTHEFKPSLPEGCAWHSADILYKVCGKLKLCCIPIALEDISVCEVYRIGAPDTAIDERVALPLDEETCEVVALAN